MAKKDLMDQLVFLKNTTGNKEVASLYEEAIEFLKRNNLEK